MSIKVLYTATATAEGGRNGSTLSGDGLIDVNLSVPKAMGGPGLPGTTTPEDLFAAGYAACFGGAVDYMATQLKLKPSSLKIECAVSIGPPPGGGFALAVALTARVGGLSPADAEKIVAAGHALCPYSNAVKGNVEVTVRTVVV
ncbi:MAG TPA: Ohr family peroxiredoxin [Nevskiaceae bacterium]|nr:Ohr family peroxiredoxin [Nevskiaceae bacterium]